MLFRSKTAEDARNLEAVDTIFIEGAIEGGNNGRLKMNQVKIAQAHRFFHDRSVFRKAHLENVMFTFSIKVRRRG